MKKLPVVLTVNGKEYSLTVESNERLLDTLRQRLGLTGTKEGCGVGECGACSVILDGNLVNSCMVLTAQCDGSRVETVEGLGTAEKLHPLQQAFIDYNAVQCGFCTPGMLMAAKALLDKNPHPTEAEIRQGLSGVLCRCTGYKQIVDAVKAAAGEEG
ncbi:MAG: (2Fe-2S)-binding protein [Bacillota bacterium]|jgi:carbon-monoxide dehydrogenase small subunit|nr:(2Fe-2S)-binding protein [Bacillota bacterium]HOC06972.1 (2Fe-2S)-binding protein [Bacillota bacterium]HPZ22604.1 (2Fe-2S)-binding protein [Bacillota bacterium]HQD20357.1 (2Fe-2S)-binding protein [Bacillota bacterium]